MEVIEGRLKSILGLFSWIGWMGWLTFIVGSPEHLWCSKYVNLKKHEIATDSAATTSRQPEEILTRRISLGLAHNFFTNHDMMNGHVDNFVADF